MSKCAVAFSKWSIINQQLIVILNFDWIMINQSGSDWVEHKNHLEFPTNERINPMSKYNVCDIIFLCIYLFKREELFNRNHTDLLIDYVRYMTSVITCASQLDKTDTAKTLLLDSSTSSSSPNRGERNSNTWLFHSSVSAPIILSWYTAIVINCVN